MQESDRYQLPRCSCATTDNQDHFQSNTFSTHDPDVMPHGPGYSPDHMPYVPGTPIYAPTSPQYSPTSPHLTAVTPACVPNMPYVPGTPSYAPISPQYSPTSPQLMAVTPACAPIESRGLHQCPRSTHAPLPQAYLDDNGWPYSPNSPIPAYRALSPAPVEETHDIIFHDDGYTTSDLRAAYPQLNERQMRALETLKYLEQDGEYDTWQAYTDRFDDLSDEATVMDRRIIQYYFNGLKRREYLRFRFVPLTQESHRHAYWRLKTAAAWSNFATLADVEDTSWIHDGLGDNCKNCGAQQSASVPVSRQKQHHDFVKVYNNELAFWSEQHEKASMYAKAELSLYERE